MKKCRIRNSIVILSLIIGFASCAKEDSGILDLTASSEAAINEDSDLKLATLAFIETDSLNQDEINGLFWMREEEKLAMDVYDLFYDEYGLKIFDNISNSELTHTEAVLSLLAFYGYDDPASATPGEFTITELQQLYDELVLMGATSLVEALMAGALIEETDILDLQEEIAQTSNSNILLVYGKLLAASKKHLVSFVKNLENYGVTYTPQKLELSVYEEILATTVVGGNGSQYGRNR